MNQQEFQELQKERRRVAARLRYYEKKKVFDPESIVARDELWRLGYRLAIARSEGIQ